MSVDLEDYFQVSAFNSVIDQKSWPGIPGRVEQNTEKLLELFDVCNITATFFVLGWIAERYPHLLARISGAGHEVASHGMRHTRVSAQKPDEFLEDIRTSKQILEDCTGKAVKGYRAASFSINAATPWAFEKLVEAGFLYSSSVYPVRHDHYGMPDAPRFAWHPVSGEPFREIPLTTCNLSGLNVPAAGGGYFRLYPYRFSKWLIRRVNDRDGQSAVFYFHPWEIDASQPRVEGLSRKTRFRHYLNLDRMANRLTRLGRDFEWQSMDEVFLNGGPA